MTLIDRVQANKSTKSRLSSPAALQWVASRSGSKSVGYEPKTNAQVAAAIGVLAEIAALKDGWDGIGSVAPSALVVDNAAFAARQLVRATADAPEIVANDTGTIAFEWEWSGASAYMEIGQSRYSMFVEFDNRPTQYFDGAVTALPDAFGSMGQALLRGRATGR